MCFANANPNNPSLQRFASGAPQTGILGGFQAAARQRAGISLSDVQNTPQQQTQGGSLLGGATQGSSLLGAGVAARRRSNPGPGERR